MADTDDDAPKCKKCRVPITTGMLALFCPHGRACAFVDDDEHWQTVEELRQDLNIERVVLSGSAGNTGVSETSDEAQQARNEGVQR